MFALPKVVASFEDSLPPLAIEEAEEEEVSRERTQQSQESSLVQVELGTIGIWGCVAPLKMWLMWIQM